MIEVSRVSMIAICRTVSHAVDPVPGNMPPR